MNLDFFVLDELELEDKTVKGIIDFSSTKHVIFYDLTNNNDPDITLMTIIWRLYHDTMRFSIFKSTYFQNVDIVPVMISKKSIKDMKNSIPLPKLHKKAMRPVTK